MNAKGKKPKPRFTATPKAARTTHFTHSHRPSDEQLDAAYKWLYSTKMADRLGKRVKPNPLCRFLINDLPEEKRKEYLERGDLSWRDWNACWNTYCPTVQKKRTVKSR